MVEPISVDAGEAGNVAEDASALVDAANPNDAASPADGGDELSQALLIPGVRVDARRVALVFAAYCKNLNSCSGTNEADCVVERTAGYMDYVNAGRGPACLDAQLDTHSCRVTMLCAPLQECLSLYRRADDLCNLNISDGG